MTKNQFANLVRNNPQHFKEMVLEKRGKIIPLKKITESKDSQRIYFHAVDEQDSFNIFKKNIADVDMLTTSRDGYQYSVIITTKSDNDFSFKVHFNMAEGYSPYAYSKNVIDNYKAVVNSIPKYMDKFIGKTVTVLHCTDTPMYRTFSEEDDGHTLPVTDSYIINDFAYEIRYDNVASNRVLVTLPLGKLKDRYVKVLTPNNHPVSIKSNEDGSKITTTQVNAVGEKFVSEYLIEKDSNGRISSITFPDGSVMNIVGF